MPNQVDPQIKSLVSAIGEAETGKSSPDAYQKKGASGEFGRYQFMPDTWKARSQKYFGDANLEPSIENQNKVQYAWVKDKKDQGYSPAQIASMHNAGEGKPNAYKEGFKGTNSAGVSYDVPAYVQKVSSNYERLKEQGGQPTTQPGGDHFAGTGTNVAQAAGNEAPKDDRGLLQKGIDFAFPIASDIKNVIQGKNEKTPLQILGDTALSASWFIPGVGMGAGLGTKLLGGVLGKGAATVAGRAAEGAALGYGADVATNLSQGKEVKDSISPGVGTLTGFIGGPAVGKLGDKLSKVFTSKGSVRGLEENIRSNVIATKPGVRLLQEAESAGYAPTKLISRAPELVPDVVEGSFLTTAQQKLAKQRIAQLGNARAEALDAIGPKGNTRLDILEAEAIAKAKPTTEMLSQMSAGERKVAMKSMATSDSLKTIAKIKAEFEHLRQMFGDQIPPSVLETIKEANAEASGIYKRTGVIGDANAHSIIGDVARKKIETIADESGLPGMREFNKYIASHYNVIELLKQMNGQKVKGGRLGNMLRSHAMGTAASVAGGLGGAGFLGSLLAFGGGELAGGVLGKIMGQTSLSNPLRDAILKRIEAENPAAVQELLNFINQGDKKVAPLLYPGGTKAKELIPGLINQGVSREASQYSQ